MGNDRSTERIGAGGGNPIPDEPSIELLRKVQGGDEAALNRLCARYIPLLQRWASGRLPTGARALLETSDIVQETVVRAIRHLDQFEYRRDGAILAYLRMALQNRIREEARKVARRPTAVAIDDFAERDRGPSPLEELIGKDQLERYEAAMLRLRDVDREAIIARIEMGLPYDRVAADLGKPTEVAARMAVSRALVRLAEVMSDESW